MIAIPAYARAYKTSNPFYHPLPDTYREGYVKDYHGIMPGKTTLGEVLSMRGDPVKVVDNHYFYYRWEDEYNGKKTLDDVYIEFVNGRRAGDRQLDSSGLDRSAYVSHIYVYSPERMRNTEIYYNNVDPPKQYVRRYYYDPNYRDYRLIYPDQGYGMFFDRDRRFYGEEYFEPRHYTHDRSYFRIRAGKFNFEVGRREDYPQFMYRYYDD